MANRYWVGGTGSWDATSGSKWALTSGGVGGQAVPTSADTVFFDANSGANTVTIGAGTSICSTLTMTGFTGTLAFGSNSIDLAGTGTIYTGASGGTLVSGTPLILCTNSSSSARTINPSPASNSETRGISFNFSAGSGSVTIGAGQSIKNLIFSGTFTGSLTNSARTIYGNLTFKTGMTVNAGANTLTFAATSGTQTITSAGLNLDFPITINAPGATVQLQDALLVGTATGRNITLTSGTFNLNNNNITLRGAFVGSGSTTRTLAFGTGQFNLTSPSGSIWSVSGTNLTITGTSPTVNLTDNATTGERTFVHVPTTVSQALSISLNVTAGSSNIGFGTGYQLFNNLNFTGFSGRIGNAGLSDSARFNIYGNLTMGAGMTCIGGVSTHDFRGTGTQLITSNGVAFNQPIGLSGTGTYSLQDAFVTGATRAISFNSGTLQTNNYSLTCGAFGYSNTNTKAFNLGTSTITILGGSGTLGWVGSNLNTTYTSVTSSTIVFTTTGTSAFSGGQSGTGNQFGTVTMSGLGGILILGTSAGQTAVRCTTLNNTVSPCTITNGCTTAFTVTNFNVSGTAGNLVTFNSNTAGTARTISKTSGTVNAYYLNIQDSTASGGAVWNAYDSTNAGNNTGWRFNYALDVLEPLTLADSANGLRTLFAAVIEDASFADITSSLVAFAAAIVEAADLADSDVVTLAFNSAITEAITLADTPTATAVFAQVVLENINVADSPTVIASFSTVITEAATASNSEDRAITAFRSLTETGTISDSQFNTAVRIADLIESITATELTSTQAAFISAIQEALTAIDAGIGNKITTSSVAEIVSALESQNRFAFYAGNITELLNAIVEANTDIPAFITETSSLSTIELANLLVNRGVLETVNASDADIGNVISNSFITEISVAGETVVVWVFFPMDYELVTSRYSSSAEIEADQIYVDNIDVFYADDDNIIASVFMEYDQIYIDNIDVLYGNLARIDGVSDDEIYI